VSILEDVISTTLSVFSVLLPIVVGIVLVLMAIWIILWLSRRSKRYERKA
jgi:membrane protein DedA with SNARE-associated domain